MERAGGSFIDPDPALAVAADPLAATDLDVFSGYRAISHLQPFAGRNPLVDAMLRRDPVVPLRYEDQCSPSYYLDVADAVTGAAASIARVVDVGVFLGGTSELFASGVDRLDYDLDLVDVDRNYLRFSFERIRRRFPEAAGRVRLFHGSLPQYVKEVLVPEQATGVFVHHDASHAFAQVVKDLSALSFVAADLVLLAIQDTNLRGRIGYCNFVDAAVWAVFGPDVRHRPIGAVFDDSHPEMLEPNRFQGNYFLPGVAEGMLIDPARNTFRYPHPSMALDEFL